MQKVKKIIRFMFKANIMFKTFIKCIRILYATQ